MVGCEKKVTEYDGKVSFDTYQAQYEALEVLEHLTPPSQLRCYDSVTGTLQRRFGRRRQSEVFRAQLKNRRRGKVEALPLLAQDVEALVRGAYSMATEDTVDMLAKDCFVDTLQNRHLQIHVNQVAHRNVQETLALAAEFETLRVSSSSVPSHHSNVSGWMSRPNRRWARRAQTSGRAPPTWQEGEPYTNEGGVL
ncbi:hypothetical protein E2C01_053705 [Portunus trituberculatus]|uniref:Uncharacterized protein n=1 Tax=Portunus trituberculatus TaxID=210409 RepID=A0A5B7GPY2_PORTR|nr:hypothetical protein [Portunus trituberculatus]